MIITDKVQDKLYKKLLDMPESERLKEMNEFVNFIDIQNEDLYLKFLSYSFFIKEQSIAAYLKEKLNDVLKIREEGIPPFSDKNNVH